MPEHDAGEFDETEEVGRESVISHGGKAVPFKASKEALVAPTLLVFEATVKVSSVAMVTRPIGRLSTLFINQECRLSTSVGKVGEALIQR